MNLHLPIFLGAAALITLPLLLHLLRIQPRRNVPFPSLAFLGKDALRDSNRHRIRRWILLLLRSLLIGLIVLGFCRPYWLFENSEVSRAVVVVVDNSFSMQAEGRRTAIEAWLAPQLAELRRPDQLGVLLLHPAPVWLVPLSDDLDAGRDALKTLPDAYEVSKYRAGIELAGAKLALSSPKQKQIWLAADQQRLGWQSVRFDRPLPAGVELIAAPAAPAPSHQAAITALKAARTAEGRISLEATVRRFSAGAGERTITFYAGNETLGMQRFALADGRVHSISAEFAVPDVNAALMLHASLDADELPVDDTAYAALPAAQDYRVMLAGATSDEEVDYLAQALGSVQGGKLPKFHIDRLPAAGRPWSTSAVAVLRGAGPFREEGSARLEAFLAAGGSAWIICDGSPEQIAWLERHEISVFPARTDSTGKLKLRDLALDHPLYGSFAGHSLGSLLAPTFRRGWKLRGAAAEPLARWPDRSLAIAEVPISGGRVLITGFGEARADSSFPIEASYVPFVHQAVTWLAQNQTASSLGSRVGETLVLPGRGTWRAVISPRAIVPAEVNVYITPTVPGIYVFEQPGLSSRFYAVNLDPAESDLAPWPTPADFARLVSPEKEENAASRVAANPRPQFLADAALVDERGAWWWLLVAAMSVLMIELAVANRTVL